MRRIRRALIVGLVTGVVGLVAALFPSVSDLEDTLGLRWLFHFRGPVQPSESVAVVSIDEGSAARMALPLPVRDWPRSVHGRLLEELTRRGVSAVAFDIEFLRHSPDPAEDAELADSIAGARRVALIQRFEMSRDGGHEIWRRWDPIPALRAAALALAPVPLPDASLVTWFWSFLETSHSGELPSLPAVTLQIHALPVLDEFLAILESAGIRGLESLPREPGRLQGADNLSHLMQAIRRAMQESAQTPSRLMRALESADNVRLSPKQKELIAALIGLYSGAPAAYLNFYGPPGRICTIPYEALFDPPGDTQVACPLEGKAVFVGMGRPRIAGNNQADRHHTVYRSPDGVDFSGVEIQATAFANLLSRTALKPLGAFGDPAMVVMFGAVLGITAYWVRTGRFRHRGAVRSRLVAAGVAIGLGSTYAILAYILFSQFRFIVPIVIPLFTQLPAALVLSLLVRPVEHRDEAVAVCLAVDAGGSTALGQQVPHQTYAKTMARYIEALRRPVWARGGEPLAPQGDGFLCVWRVEPRRLGLLSAETRDRAVRVQACLAALEMCDAAKEFTQANGFGDALPPRVGLSVGVVTIHSDTDRGAFELFGDPANLAGRLRDLNVLYATRVLATERVVTGLQDALCLRRIADDFVLKGVSEAPMVFEIAGCSPDVGSDAPSTLVTAKPSPSL